MAVQPPHITNPLLPGQQGPTPLLHGPVQPAQASVPQQQGPTPGGGIAGQLPGIAANPGNYMSGSTQYTPQGIPITPGTYLNGPEDNIPMPWLTAGYQVGGVDPRAANTYQASMIGQDNIPVMGAAQGQVSRTVQAEQGTVSKGAHVGGVSGNAAQIGAMPTRTLDNGELVSAVTVDDVGGFVQVGQEQSNWADYMTAAQGGPVGTGDPTVAGQLATLYSQFENGGIPAWAAGANRAANEAMAARGMGASSMAASAIVQAMMESALPIAMEDANKAYDMIKTNLGLEQQARLENMRSSLTVDMANLSNRQQARLMEAQLEAALKGQEMTNRQQAGIVNAAKVSEVLNMNFNAEQLKVVENARLMQSMTITNVNNAQAAAISTASNYAQMDVANLNARMTAQVENARNFLSMDMANLDARQQSAVLTYQSRVQAMFTDSAAKNVAKQFNALSQNDMDKFYSSLNSGIEQFNVSQGLSRDQFNSSMATAHEQFAQNMGLQISQSNVNWLRGVSTADTLAYNTANEINTARDYGLGTWAYDSMLQLTRDTAAQIWTSAENAETRAHNVSMMALGFQMGKEGFRFENDILQDNALGEAAGGLLTDLITDDGFWDAAGDFLDGLFG